MHCSCCSALHGADRNLKKKSHKQLIMTQNILDGRLYLCVQSFSNFIGLNQHLCGTQYVYIAYV